MSIDLVVATDLQGGVGKNNELLIKSEIDMRERFKKHTEGHFTLLARKTYESLPKPLRNRVNVVLTRNEEYKIDPHLLSEYEIIVVNDLDKVINHYNTGENKRNLVVCGGSELYHQSLVHVDRVFLTIFNKVIEGADSFFDLEYVDKHFEVIHRETITEEINGEVIEMEFIDYVRKNEVDVDGEE